VCHTRAGGILSKSPPDPPALQERFRHAKSY
jgi:hypothetical protein